MLAAFLCEGVRTPIGRFGGALAQVRTDDLAAHPLKILREKFSNSDWAAVEKSSSVAAIRREKTIATWRAWPCCCREFRTPCRV